MKRFFCTECQKVRRVRRMPSNVKAYNADNVMERQGTCDWHVTGRILPMCTKQPRKVVVTTPVKVSQKRGR